MGRRKHQKEERNQQKDVEGTSQRMEKLSVNEPGPAPPRLTPEDAAIEAENRLKTMNLQALPNVKEFMKLPKALQNEVVKRPWIRRMMVAAAFSPNCNHNTVMNKIKKLTGRRECPVKMEEIQYVIRRLEARETLLLDTPLEVLLEEEAKKKQREADAKFEKEKMLGLPENPNMMKEIVHDLRVRKAEIIGLLEVRVNLYGTESTFVGVNTGFIHPASVIQNSPKQYHYKKAFIEVMALLEHCRDNFIEISRFNLFINGCDESRRFLYNVTRCPFLYRVHIGTVEIRNPGAICSENLTITKFILCDTLWLCDGRFVEETEAKFVKALHKCNPALDRINIITKEPIPEFIKDWQPVFDVWEVTASDQTAIRDKFVVFQKVDRTVHYRDEPDEAESEEELARGLPKKNLVYK